MKERFFFNRVQIDRTRISIDEAVILSIPILTDPAITPFPLGNPALSGTELTLDLSPLEGCEIGRKLRLDQAFLNDLSLGGFRKTEEITSGKHAEACSTELQELPFGHPRLKFF
jgi:hypothetical protein